MTTPNGKYIVFKRKDWDTNHPLRSSLTVDQFEGQYEVDDAVVIRRQDLFAPPALNVYAHSISLAAKLLKRMGQDAYASELQNIADYFHEQAELASEEAYKLPD